jgi:hypothetical protein
VKALLLIDTLSQLHETIGVLLQGYIFLCLWLPAFDFYRPLLTIDGHEDDDAVRGLGVQDLFGVGRAGIPGVVYPLHDRAPVHFTAEVDVRQLSYES